MDNSSSKNTPDPSKVELKRNLWFGITSRFDETSTESNYLTEKQYLINAEHANYVEDMMKNERIMRKTGGKVFGQRHESTEDEVADQ